MSAPRVILGVSGASGAALALSAARQLAGIGVALDLVISPAAERTLREECGPEALDSLRALALRCHAVSDVGAPIASGSVPIDGMIVAPCSMRSLAAMAHGLDDNLLTRAAGVQLKERRRLILLTREAPLTLAHLRNHDGGHRDGGRGSATGAGLLPQAHWSCRDHRPDRGPRDRPAAPAGRAGKPAGPGLGRAGMRPGARFVPGSGISGTRVTQQRCALTRKSVSLPRRHRA